MEFQGFYWKMHLALPIGPQMTSCRLYITNPLLPSLPSCMSYQFVRSPDLATCISIWYFAKLLSALTGKLL